MTSLNDIASANRIHIGIFGRTNSGKSSLINSWTGQQVSIVSDVKGTTTDPVSKPMEINPLGPCVIIDTAGFDDDTSLGQKREEKTKLALQKCDIAVLVLDGQALSASCAKEKDNSRIFFSAELRWLEAFKERNIKHLLVVNKADLLDDGQKKAINNLVLDLFSEEPILLSAISQAGIGQFREMLMRLVPEDFDKDTLLGNLVGEGDSVMLVMPQDIQAPKGRLILPQVQTLRELLDKKCHVTCVTTDQFVASLQELKNAPKLIITDSQVFKYVYENKPQESLLTSFSILMAANKGDIDYFVQGAKAIDALTEKSRVLIAEACSHAPLSEDIGREKIPALLRKKVGPKLTIEMVSGTDFPKDLSKYDLVIHCGACMFNKKYVLSRVEQAKDANVPMTNYGVTIAYLNQILDKILFPT